MQENPYQAKSQPIIASLSFLQINDQLKAQKQQKDNIYPVRGRVNLSPIKAYNILQDENGQNKKSSQEQEFSIKKKKLDISYDIKVKDRKDQSPYDNEFHSLNNLSSGKKMRSLLNIDQSSSSRIFNFSTQTDFKKNKNQTSYTSFRITEADQQNQNKIKSNTDLDQNSRTHSNISRLTTAQSKLGREISPLIFSKPEIKSYTFLQDEKNQMLMTQIQFKKPKISKIHQNYYHVQPSKTTQKNALNISVDKRCNTAINFQFPARRLKNEKQNIKMEDEQIKQASSSPLRDLCGLPSISAESWSVLDANTGTILYGNNENIIRQMASLTKMMTLYVSIKVIQTLDISPYRTYVEVSKKAASMIGTSARLQEGDRLNLWDLMHGMMLPSGNDAATALAENLGVFLFYQSDEYKRQYSENPEQFTNSKYRVKNSQSYFIEEMNKYAKILELKNTNFSNPTGLVNNFNRSTAADLAKLSYHLTQEEKVQKIVVNKYHFAQIYMNSDKKRSMIFENTNKLLSHGYSGLKTGITTAAGPCLSAWYKDDNVNLIIILLNSSSMEQRWEDTQNLVNWVSNKQQDIYPQSSLLP